MTWLISDK